MKNRQTCHLLPMWHGLSTQALCTQKELEPLFTLDFYGSLIGCVELNNWGESAVSPLAAYYKHVVALKPVRLCECAWAHMCVVQPEQNMQMLSCSGLRVQAQQEQVQRALGPQYWQALKDRHSTASEGAPAHRARVPA